MDISVKRLTDASTNEDVWVLYEPGNFQHPIRLLTVYEVDRLSASIQEARKAPKRVEELRKK